MAVIMPIGFCLQDGGELELGMFASKRQCRSPIEQCWELELNSTQWCKVMSCVNFSRKFSAQSLCFEDLFTLLVYLMGTNVPFYQFFPSHKYQTL